MTLGVVILAAGKGTRMHSAMPKVLHEAAGLPLVEHVARLADHIQATKKVLVLSEDCVEAVQSRFGDRYSYVVQHKRLGTGHAVLQARAALDGQVDEVLVLYGADPLMRVESLAGLVELRRETQALAAITTFIAQPPAGYGRIVRNERGQVQAIVEEKNASAEQRLITEVNQGVAVYAANWLWPALEALQPNPATHEYYLTDLVEQALQTAGEGAVVAWQLADAREALGVNDRWELAQASAILQARKLQALMQSGVTIIDPATTYIDLDVVVGPDTVILPGTLLRGATSIGRGCTIGPHSMIVDSTLADRCKVVYSVIEHARMETGCDIGPFGHLRKGAHLMEDVHMGNFGEVKNATLGRGTKMGHFSYIGDADVGADVNIGAGTITCNFAADGRKYRTEIGDGAFIGSDTLLRAPVTVGERGVTGAGSVVTKDVPPGGVAVGMPARVIRRLPPSEDSIS